MGRKTQRQIKSKQEVKRKKRRLKLTKAGKNPDEHFYGGTYVTKSQK